MVFARSRHILCQGRGAAANPAVCHCLGVTEVDPSRLSMLFERFINREPNKPPGIDGDFKQQLPPAQRLARQKIDMLALGMHSAICRRLNLNSAQCGYMREFAEGRRMSDFLTHRCGACDGLRTVRVPVSSYGIPVRAGVLSCVTAWRCHAA